MKEDVHPDIYESANQLAGIWEAIVRNYGSGDILSSGGIATRWSESSFPFFNTITYTEMADGAQLDQRLAASVGYMKGRRHPGFIFLFEELLSSETKAILHDALAKTGLRSSLRLTGMAADLARLDLTPVRPPELSFVRVESEAHVRAYADINCRAYGIPIEAGRDGFGKSDLWTEAYAYLGVVDGIPVSAAATMVVDGRLFLALVATLPESQGRGYGKATVLMALDEGSRATGLTRSVLHATDAGRPVYERIGYYKTSTISCLALSDQAADQ
jgi:ribosomal protein S18 acetylase RimI-like enzyme